MEQPRARYISIMRLLTERCRSTQTPSQAQVMGGAGSRGPKATGAHTPALGARRDHDPWEKVPLGALPNWSPNPVRLARYTASPDADGRTGERVSLEKARRGDRTGFGSTSEKALMDQDKAAGRAGAWAA